MLLPIFQFELGTSFWTHLVNDNASAFPKFQVDTTKPSYNDHFKICRILDQKLYIKFYP